MAFHVLSIIPAKSILIDLRLITCGASEVGTMYLGTVTEPTVWITCVLGLHLNADPFKE